MLLPPVHKLEAPKYSIEKMELPKAAVTSYEMLLNVNWSKLLVLTVRVSEVKKQVNRRVALSVVLDPTIEKLLWLKATVLASNEHSSMHWSTTMLSSDTASSTLNSNDTILPALTVNASK